MTDKECDVAGPAVTRRYQQVTQESNPVAWAYAHGSDLGGNLDQARWESLEDKLYVPQRHDWHYGAPKKSWRRKDGSVISIEAMDDSYLRNTIRFAAKRSKHHSRLKALTIEYVQRGLLKD